MSLFTETARASVISRPPEFRIQPDTPASASSQVPHIHQAISLSGREASPYRSTSLRGHPLLAPYKARTAREDSLTPSILMRANDQYASVPLLGGAETTMYLDIPDALYPETDAKQLEARLRERLALGEEMLVPGISEDNPFSTSGITWDARGVARRLWESDKAVAEMRSLQASTETVLRSARAMQNLDSSLKEDLGTYKEPDQVRIAAINLSLEELVSERKKRDLAAVEGSTKRASQSGAVFSNRAALRLAADTQSFEKKSHLQALESELSLEREEILSEALVNARAKSEDHALSSPSRTQPPNQDFLLLKDGLDMTLQSLQTDALRMSARASDLSAALEKLAGDVDVRGALKRGNLDAEQLLLMREQQRVLLEQKLVKNEVALEKRFEQEQQFWLERENRQKFYADLYERSAAAMGISQDAAAEEFLERTRGSPLTNKISEAVSPQAWAEARSAARRDVLQASAEGRDVLQASAANYPHPAALAVLRAEEDAMHREAKKRAPLFGLDGLNDAERRRGVRIRLQQRLDRKLGAGRSPDEGGLEIKAGLGLKIGGGLSDRVGEKLKTEAEKRIGKAAEAQALQREMDATEFF